MAHRLPDRSKLRLFTKGVSASSSFFTPAPLVGYAALRHPRTISTSKISEKPAIAITTGPVSPVVPATRAGTPSASTKEVRDGNAFATLPLTWPHEGWNENVLLNVVPSHREPRTFGDWIAWKIVRTCRFWMDLVTGMRPEQQVDSKHPTTAISASKPLTERQWLVRFIFLESIAGVPGMVAGSLRHLQSIRRFKPDQGWIKSLLEESYNERMHLLTFLEMYKPGWFMRLVVLGAQGVFYNAMFISYLFSPKICHRFVGYLEEEAVHTYTRCLLELDHGYLKRWSDPNFRIPDIAVRYWNMPEGHRTMKDLILYVRADEASHRGVNHTFGNLDQVSDPNPFMECPGGGIVKAFPKHLSVTRPAGLEREEVISKETH